MNMEMKMLGQLINHLEKNIYEVCLIPYIQCMRLNVKQYGHKNHSVNLPYIGVGKEF